MKFFASLPSPQHLAHYRHVSKYRKKKKLRRIRLPDTGIDVNSLVWRIRPGKQMRRNKSERDAQKNCGGKDGGEKPHGG